MIHTRERTTQKAEVQIFLSLSLSLRPRRREPRVHRDDLDLLDELLPRRRPAPRAGWELDDRVPEHEGPNAVAEAVGVEPALEGGLAGDLGGERGEEGGVELMFGGVGGE
mgnify:FL=1